MFVIFYLCLSYLATFKFQGKSFFAFCIKSSGKGYLIIQVKNSLTIDNFVLEAKSNNNDDSMLSRFHGSHEVYESFV